MISTALRKSLVFAMIFAAAAAPVPDARAADYRLSLTGGIVYGSLSQDYGGNTSYQSSNGIGLVGGAQLTRSMGESFEGEAALMYLQRTWKDTTSTNSYDLAYLSMPLTVRYKLTHGLALLAGGYVATPVGNYQGMAPSLAGFSNIDAGYVAGLTVTTDVASNMRLELRYEASLLNNANSTAIAGGTTSMKWSELLFLASFPIFGH